MTSRKKKKLKIFLLVGDEVAGARYTGQKAKQELGMCSIAFLTIAMNWSVKFYRGTGIYK